MTPRQIQRFGWRPDLPDHRDLMYSVALEKVNQAPPVKDLREFFPACYDQGDLGSCTANAIAGALEYAQKHEQRPEFTPSRLFIYYNERKMEGTVDQDSGAQIRDGIKSVASLGFCKETTLPYDIAKFAEAPSVDCYKEAKRFRATSYHRIPQSLAMMKGCLASGFPFVFGFTVYDSFESDRVASTGVVPMPTLGDSVLGGHAALAVGYDEPNRVFICRNSWGTEWGLKGYFLLPYAYAVDSNLASDFWTIRLVLDP